VRKSRSRRAGDSRTFGRRRILSGERCDRCGLQIARQHVSPASVRARSAAVDSAAAEGERLES
jgi:hypothetical protein